MSVEESLEYIKQNQRGPLQIVESMKNDREQGVFVFGSWMRELNERAILLIVDEPPDVLLCVNKKDAFKWYVENGWF